MYTVTRLLIWMLISFNSFGQNQSDSLKVSTNPSFTYKALIIPAVLIGYGAIGLESHTLKNFNSNTANELTEHIDEKISIDDFSQYSPFLTVYALNAAGVKGKNNFRDRTMILTTAYLIMGGTVYVIKATGNEMRPDGTSNNSFPSGHTATAFMGAEFLYQEFKDVSIWYGITGFVVAAGTGFFRMYNDRHWFSDVAAGAGIGILSTKIAYWVHPYLNRMLFTKKSKTTGIILPSYKEGKIGLAAVITF